MFKSVPFSDIPLTRVTRTCMMSKDRKWTNGSVEKKLKGVILVQLPNAFYAYKAFLKQ